MALLTAAMVSGASTSKGDHHTDDGIGQAQVRDGVFNTRRQQLRQTHHGHQCDHQQAEADGGLARRRWVGVAVSVEIEQAGDVAVSVGGDRHEEVPVPDGLGEHESAIKGQRSRRRECQLRGGVLQTRRRSR